MERYRDYGQKDTRMASVETSINKTQRPTIIVDMEFALLKGMARFEPLKLLNLGTVLHLKEYVLKFKKNPTLGQKS